MNNIEKKEKICLLCGSKIEGKYKYIKKFCNSSCAAKYNNSRRIHSDETKEKIRNKLKGRKKTQKIIKKVKYCKMCGNVVPTLRHVYCSKECQYKYKYLNYGFILICDECGLDFKSHNKKQKFCSYKCSTEHRQRILIDKWLCGKTVFNPNNSIPNYIRKYLYEKVIFKCEDCGFEGYNRVTGNSILQIHHIDGNSGNNNISNLKVLCPNCHAMTENYMSLNKGYSARNKRYQNK